MGLYKYEVHQDTSLLKSNQTPTRQDESLHMLKENVIEMQSEGRKVSRNG